MKSKIHETDRKIKNRTKIILYLSLVMITTSSCEKDYNCVCKTSETPQNSVATNFSVTGTSQSEAESSCKAFNNGNYFTATTSCKLN